MSNPWVASIQSEEKEGYSKNFVNEGDIIKLNAYSDKLGDEMNAYTPPGEGIEASHIRVEYTLMVAIHWPNYLLRLRQWTFNHVSWYTKLGYEPVAEFGLLLEEYNNFRDEFTSKWGGTTSVPRLERTKEKASTVVSDMTSAVKFAAVAAGAIALLLLVREVR